MVGRARGHVIARTRRRTWSGCAWPSSPPGSARR